MTGDQIAIVITIFNWSNPYLIKQSSIQLILPSLYLHKTTPRFTPYIYMNGEITGNYYRSPISNRQTTNFLLLLLYYNTHHVYRHTFQSCFVNPSKHHVSLNNKKSLFSFLEVPSFSLLCASFDGSQN